MLTYSKITLGYEERRNDQRTRTEVRDMVETDYSGKMRILRKERETGHCGQRKGGGLHGTEVEQKRKL